MTITHSQTNRIAGFGILFPPRSIAPRIRCIIGVPEGAASGALVTSSPSPRRSLRAG